MQIIKKGAHLNFAIGATLLSYATGINSGKMESNPGDIPGFRCLRAAASYSGLKSSEVL